MRAFDPTTAAHSRANRCASLAARAPWLVVLLLGALSVASGCVAYDPDAEESAMEAVDAPELGQVRGALEGGDSASLALAEGGGAPTAAQGLPEAERLDPEAEWLDPEAPPAPPVVYQRDSEETERSSGELRADPSPDPWR